MMHMTAQTYFRLVDAPESDVGPERWFLRGPLDSDGNEVDARGFVRGISVSFPDRLWVPLREVGTPLDITFADFEVPIVRQQVASLLESIVGGAIQRIPVSVESTGDRYEILNIVSKVRCLDEERSVYKWWTEADRRPDKVGKYRGVNPIVITAALAEGHDLFRIEGWEVALIASNKVVAALRTARSTGVKFVPLETT